MVPRARLRGARHPARRRRCQHLAAAARGIGTCGRRDGIAMSETRRLAVDREVSDGTLRPRVKQPLILLLALASLLRLVLVVQGGQMYWPDERLYTQVLDIFDLHRGSAFEILKGLFSTQDHLGFALISAIPAAIQ